jgi:phospholipid transport system substrate-binding protein
MLRLEKYLMVLVLFVSHAAFALEKPVDNTATSSTAPNPIKMLNDAAQQTITQITALRTAQKIADNAPTPFPAVYKIIDNILIPMVDLPSISQKTIGPAFKKASPADQQHFMNAYKILLINTYGVVLTHYKNQKVQFFNVRGGYQGLSQIKVNSQFIFPERDPIKVTYSLILDKKTNQWKVIDMSVEGISLLESFKSQFSAELQQGGMKQLLTTLDTHNKNISEKMNHPQTAHAAA